MCAIRSRGSHLDEALCARDVRALHEAVGAADDDRRLARDLRDVWCVARVNLPQLEGVNEDSLVMEQPIATKMKSDRMNFLE